MDHTDLIVAWLVLLVYALIIVVFLEWARRRLEEVTRLLKKIGGHIFRTENLVEANRCANEALLIVEKIRRHLRLFPSSADTSDRTPMAPS